MFGVGAHEGEPHPAHIHTGTCGELGDVVVPLDQLALADGEGTGPESARAADVSETTVNLALTDIIAGGHAINVHESEANIGTYIACGDIGGVVVEGRLIIGLGELNDSGYTGVAVLEENGDQTDVTAYVPRSDDGEGASGTPAAAGETAESAEEVAVEIVSYTFPEQLEVAAGTTVTWTNMDSVPHTVTSNPNGDAFQSGALREGETFTFTFTEAGTYEYFCEFHPGMKGTVVVT
ncbi:MAG TPA: cupredoxin family copper-binding protein [Thermomicrobiales bacterium]|nr:cupredoxin family copper-binding protein [Thermomicrobiales bacterium]